MTIDEFGRAFLELIISVGTGIAGVFRFAGDILIDRASPSGPALPSNSLKLFSNVTINRIVFFLLAAYILFINIFTFISFATDKSKAKRKEIRISEKRLMLLCVIGGAAGGLLGMRGCRHKTQKRRFSIGVPVLMIIQAALYCFALGFLGFWAFF